MVKIPLVLKLKRKKHREIAELQDILMGILYEVMPKTVLHGGTAIWRCYSGNRFSGDIDVYFEKNLERIEEVFDKLRRIGFKIVKKRIKENSLFSVLIFNNIEIRLEAVFKRVNGTIKEYETSEGSLINIYTLLPEDLIKEKVESYLKRKKIRDLYDIFFLLKYVEEIEKIKYNLKNLIENFKEPINEGELKTLILFGITPTKKEILEYIKRYLR